MGCPHGFSFDFLIQWLVAAFLTSWYKIWCKVFVYLPVLAVILHRLLSAA